MAIVVITCPHCSVERLAFPVQHTARVSSGKGALFLQCPHCQLPVCAVIDVIGSSPRPLDELKNYGSTLQDQGWGIVSIWPEPPEPQIADHVPAEVARVMLQAERNFPTAGNEEAAGTMYRKALDVGLKIVAPDAKGTLAARIDALVQKNLLTPSLGAWSHQIRLLGNDTAHEIEAPMRDELTALRDFTDLVLRYLFTLPKMVEIRKGSDVKA
jgi:hypothetical protein